MAGMRMIPDQIVESTKSRAEIRFFEELRSIDNADWFYALHSLNVPQHHWKRMCEIDFLLVGPRGVYALEVKGGNLACHNGVWSFKDRAGIRRRRESPFAQVRSAMFAMEKDLAEKAAGLDLRHMTFGSGVILPDCVLDVLGTEWSAEEVLDRDLLDATDGTRRGLGRMASYWRAKPGRRTGLLSRKDADALLAVLRPDFDTVPTLRQMAGHAETVLASLTTNQYRALDAHDRNRRVVYEGGAGTGKTLLAVELCRRRAAAGCSVLFTCRSEILAGFVTTQLEATSVEVVASGHLNSLTGRSYDVVVADEAQDLINYTDLDALDRLVVGGLHEGEWHLYLDSNNQRGLIGTYDREAMEFLTGIRPAFVGLSDNCRNTRQIIATTQRVTGADVGISTAGTGPEVTFEYAVSPQSAAARVLAVLEHYEHQGVDTSDIVLLSPAPYEESSFAHLPIRWQQRIQQLDLHRMRSPSPGRLGFARTGDFKGLESRFVVLDHFRQPASGNGPAHLYVGMTRARVGLWVIAHEHQRAAIEHAMTIDTDGRSHR
jgi:nuclease-like protein